MTVEYLENAMSESEYLEWLEYYSIEPFAPDRSEIQMAVLSTIQSNKSGGNSKVEDFVISSKKKTTKTGALEEQLKAIFGG